MLRLRRASLLLGLLATPLALADSPRPGAPATPVVVEDLFGKPVAVPTGRRAVLFYEDDKSGAGNLRAHKKVAEIVDRFGGNPGFDVMIVADTQAFNYWPARGFALKELRKIEKVEKAPVFADWTGGIVRGWKLQRGRCSLTVLDADGKVQFHVDGPLTERQLTELEHVLVPEVATR